MSCMPAAQIQATPIIVRCPYQEPRCIGHQFREDVLESHMRMVHRHKYMHTIKPCKHNQAHLYPAAELELHEINCPDRMVHAQMDAYIDDGQKPTQETEWVPLQSLFDKVKDTFGKDMRRGQPRRDYQA